MQSETFREVALVDGALYWMTADRRPGTPVDLVKVENYQVMIDGSNQLLLGPPSVLRLNPEAPEAASCSESTLEGGNDEIEQPNKMSSKLDNFHEQERLLRELLGRSRCDPFVAFDLYGKIDIDAHNPGPELDPHGQRTDVGAILCQDEEAMAHFQQRTKLKIAANVTGLSDILKASETCEDMSRSSSSSSLLVISIKHDEDTSKFSQCADDCWLRTDMNLCGSLARMSLASSTSLSTNSSKTKSDIYHRLEYGEKRVLRVLPGQPGDPIVCQLLNMVIPGVQSCTSHSEIYCGSYVALSYTWGIGHRLHSIICNDAPLPVMENLFSALLNLRQTDHDLVIWIDAVCINQDNVIERNAQVQYMMEIYKGASSVVVWIGHECDESDLAISAMEVLDDKEKRKSIMQ